jgi:hypothetical protein
LQVVEALNPEDVPKPRVKGKGKNIDLRPESKRPKGPTKAQQESELREFLQTELRLKQGEAKFAEARALRFEEEAASLREEISKLRHQVTEQAVDLAYYQATVSVTSAGPTNHRQPHGAGSSNHNAQNYLRRQAKKQGRNQGHPERVIAEAAVAPVVAPVVAPTPVIAPPSVAPSTTVTASTSVAGSASTAPTLGQLQQLQSLWALLQPK